MSRSNLFSQNRSQSASTRTQWAHCRRSFEPLEARLVFAAIQDWQVRGVGGGGSLYSPSFNPANPQEIYIASDMGQIFHTTSDGAAWQTVDFRQTYGGPDSKVQFTNNPPILYTIDYASGGDEVVPTKSVDGGMTWTPLGADPTGGGAITIVADYNNPSRLLVSDYSHIWISTDGGAHFTQRFSTNNSAGVLLAGAFFDGNNIYVGTNQGLLVSTNGGASNFTVATNTGIPTGQKIESFAGAKQNGTVRLWVVTAPTADVFAGLQGYDASYGGLYRIDNPLGVQTATWTSITSGITGGATPFYIASSLADINTVYVAGGNSNTSSPTVYQSTNGGNSWTSVLQTANNGNVQTGWSGAGGDRGWSYGELALGFTVDPLDANRLVITDEGFAHLSEDGGAHWRALYVSPSDLNPAGQLITPGQAYHSSGLENTSSWDLTWASPTRIIGSFTDIRSAVSDDGGNSWSFNYSGDTQNSMYRSVVVERNLQEFVYAAVSSVHDMYQSTHLTDGTIDGGSGQVLLSTDQGLHWQLMHDFGHVVTWVEADPSNPNRLYASVANSAAGGIYVTNDAQDGASSTWTQLAAPPRTQGHAFNLQVLNDGTLVATYSGRRDSSGAFTASSGVFVSTNGGQSWQDVSDPGMLYWTKDVTIDPADPHQNTWYVSVFSGFGGPPNGLGGLYRTTNRGATWEKINSLDRVNSIAVDPDDPNQAYLTTEIDGLWYTNNLQSASPTFTQVTGYNFMQPMRVVYNPYNSNEVWVTSFGGGLRVGYSTPVVTAGDFTGDGHVDGADLKPMMQALTNQGAYLASHPGMTSAQLTQLGDVNGDGNFSNADVQFLINKLRSGAGSSSPSAMTAIGTSGATVVGAAEPTNSGPTNSTSSTSSNEEAPPEKVTAEDLRSRSGMIDLALRTTIDAATPPASHSSGNRRAMQLSLVSRPALKLNQSDLAATQIDQIFGTLGAGSAGHSTRKASHWWSFDELHWAIDGMALRERS